MRKFDETMHIDQNWKEITINDKWVPVVIESPDIIGWNDTVKMICQCDSMFSGYRVGGNDRVWNRTVWDEAGVPEEVPDWLYADDPVYKGNMLAPAQLKLNEVRDKFVRKWNTNPGICSDATVFQSELFSSAYIGGPFSFVNLKTGKVGLVHNIGKWCGKVGYIADELEWFAKNYPQYKFFVTFCDNDYTEDGVTQIELCTLMLYDGKITRVTTRTKKQFKYVYKINHLKGSTCAKKTPRLIRAWRHFKWNYLPFNRSFRAWWCQVVLPKISTNLYNEWVIDHNYSLENCKNERYFDAKHMCAIIDEYKEILKKENK